MSPTTRATTSWERPTSSTAWSISPRRLAPTTSTTACSNACAARFSAAPTTTCACCTYRGRLWPLPRAGRLRWRPMRCSPAPPKTCAATTPRNAGHRSRCCTPRISTLLPKTIRTARRAGCSTSWKTACSRCTSAPTTRSTPCAPTILPNWCGGCSIRGRPTSRRSPCPKPSAPLWPISVTRLPRWSKGCRCVTERASLWPCRPTTACCASVSDGARATA